MLHPGGRFKTCWNVMVAACVLHDLLVIPLNTFSFPQNVFWDLTSWLPDKDFGFHFAKGC